MNRSERTIFIGNNDRSFMQRLQTMSEEMKLGLAYEFYTLVRQGVQNARVVNARTAREQAITILDSLSPTALRDIPDYVLEELLEI